MKKERKKREKKKGWGDRKILSVGFWMTSRWLVALLCSAALLGSALPLHWTVCLPVQIGSLDKLN
jgi:hypothetical protein